MDFLALFCCVHDFCVQKLPVLAAQFRAAQASQLTDSTSRECNQGLHDPFYFPASRMHISEVMTIIIGFHTSNIRTFKHYYFYLRLNHSRDFPTLVSYQRLVELIHYTPLPLMAYLNSRLVSSDTIFFIDSTALDVCDPKRISRNRVFHDVAKIGKTTKGWFYGFKVHLIVTQTGELAAVRFTAGNCDDREPVDGMSKRLHGLMFGDKGYVSQDLFEQLWSHGLKLVTNIKKNMKNKLMVLREKLLLRKRSIIETIIDQLKNISQIEHSRHRAVPNCFANIIAGLIAYTHQPKKPAITWLKNEPSTLALLGSEQLLLT